MNFPANPPLPQAPSEALNRQLQFLLTADQLKTVERRTFVSDGSRHENSAEHSWHLALAVMLFAPLARDQNLDVGRAIQLALVHDLVEIGAGDTYVYDTAGRETQAAREIEAANEIFGMLPETQGAEFRAKWDEFEELQTPEAQFVRALDRMLPLVLNFVTGGKAWVEHGINVEQVRALNLPALEAAPALKQYFEMLIEDAQTRGFLRAAPDEIRD